jgi:hypothetical protein
MNNESVKYKRVLIIAGNNLASNSSTDITLRSYFEHWPKDKLMILTSEDTIQPFARTVIIYSKIFNRIRTLSHIILLKNIKKIDNRNIVPGTIINDAENHMGIRQRIFAIGAAYVDMFYFKLSKGIIKAIDDYKPEIIYTLMSGIRLNKITVKCSVRYNISIIPHFMDDWISTIYTGSVWLKIPRRLLLYSLDRLLEFTKVGLCISQKMCEEYEIKFNKKFLPLMNVVNPEYFKYDHKDIKNNLNELVFTFFGGLHLNRWKTLMMVSEVLNSLSTNLEKNLKLEIYTSEDNIRKYSSEFKFSNVTFHKFIEHKAACLEMQKADFLLHVESFDESVIQFTRLSISTKIPEYLASWTPIIAIGPANIASIEYLNENDCAYIVSNLNFNDMQKLLLASIRGHNSGLYLKNKLRLVETNHSSRQIVFFRELLLNS